MQTALLSNSTEVWLMIYDMESLKSHPATSTINGFGRAEWLFNVLNLVRNSFQFMKIHICLFIYSFIHSHPNNGDCCLIPRTWDRLFSDQQIWRLLGLKQFFTTQTVSFAQIKFLQLILTVPMKYTHTALTKHLYWDICYTSRGYKIKQSKTSNICCFKLNTKNFSTQFYFGERIKTV